MVDVHAINGTDPSRLYESVPWFRDLQACHRCGCRDEALRVVPGSGPRDAGMLWVGQNPGAEEDEVGAPFVGRAGNELDEWFTFLGLDRRKMILTNAVKCHTTHNRLPTRREVTVCQEAWLRQELETFTEIRVVIALGRMALEAMVGKVEGIPDVMAPWWMRVDYGDRVLHLLPLPHPVYLLRAPGQRTTMYGVLLPWVLDYLKREVPDVYERARHP